MRIHGTLSQWNDQDSSGTIAPARGGPAVVVDLAAFAPYEQPPRLNERLSFELGLDKYGNTRARGVRRVTRSRLASRLRIASHPSPRNRKRAGRAAAIALVIASAAYMYSAYLFTAYSEAAHEAKDVQKVHDVNEALYAHSRQSLAVE